jgi:hypothetical protein
MSKTRGIGKPLHFTRVAALLALGAGCHDRTPARDGAPVAQGGTLDAHAASGDASIVGVSDAATHASDASGPGTPDAGAAASCPLPGCPETTLAAGTDLNGVWAGPAGEVWAVGKGGTVGRREPSSGRWCWCTPGPDVAMNAVWGDASDDVWIVGDGGAVLRFGGSGFSTVDVHTDVNLADVWGSSASNLFVVGDGGVSRHFDGSAWVDADVGAEHQLRAAWGSSATAIWAVGRRPVHATWDGAEAEVFSWTGGTWVKQAGFLEERGAAGFDGISGSAPDDVWAVGHKFPSGAAAGFAFAAHFDGTSWTATDAPEDARINRDYTDVAANAPHAAWITASGDTEVHVDGTTWTASDPMTTNLLAIDGRGGDLWATGRDGKILHRGTSGSWTVERAPTPAGP